VLVAEGEGDLRNGVDESESESDEQRSSVFWTPENRDHLFELGGRGDFDQLVVDWSWFTISELKLAFAEEAARRASSPFSEEERVLKKDDLDGEEEHQSPLEDGVLEEEAEEGVLEEEFLSDADGWLEEELTALKDGMSGISEQMKKERLIPRKVVKKLKQFRLEDIRDKAAELGLFEVGERATEGELPVVDERPAEALSIDQAKTPEPGDEVPSVDAETRDKIWAVASTFVGTDLDWIGLRMQFRMFKSVEAAKKFVAEERARRGGDGPFTEDEVAVLEELGPRPGPFEVIAVLPRLGEGRTLVSAWDEVDRLRESRNAAAA
jgi:hypothetical protein